MVHNSTQPRALAPVLRTYDGSLEDFYAADPLKNPGKVTGKVVAIDVPRTSLVLKPSVLRRVSASRYWVNLVDRTGAPLVDIDFAED